MVEGSGTGTELFSMVRNPDGTGSLRIVKPLDFEDPLQRSGFRFKIQVNDQVNYYTFLMVFKFAVYDKFVPSLKQVPFLAPLCCKVTIPIHLIIVQLCVFI